MTTPEQESRESAMGPGGSERLSEKGSDPLTFNRQQTTYGQDPRGQTPIRTAAESEAWPAADAALLVAVAMTAFLVLVERQTTGLSPVLLGALLVMVIAGFWRSSGWEPLAVFILAALIQANLDEHPLGLAHLYPPLSWGDLAIAACVLAYLVGQSQYRFAVRRSARSAGMAPPATTGTDPAVDRSGQRWWGSLRAGVPMSGPMLPRFRPEFLRTVLLVPIWPLAATLIRPPQPLEWAIRQRLELGPSLARLLASFWTLGGIVLVCVALWSYVRRRRLTPMEARLALDDLVWRELRPELDRSARRAAKS